MAFTTKDVRPVFEARMGPTRRFVVKGNVAFAVLDSGEPVLGFVNFYGNEDRALRCPRVQESRRS